MLTTAPTPAAPLSFPFSLAYSHGHLLLAPRPHPGPRWVFHSLQLDLFYPSSARGHSSCARTASCSETTLCSFQKMHHHSISVQSSFVTKVTQNKSWTKGQGTWESLEGQEILNILCFKPWALEGTHANKLSLGLEIRAL